MASASLRVKVSDNNDLVRDSFSGAIINRNRDEYIKSISARNRAVQVNARIERLESSVSTILETLQDISKKLDKRP